MRPLLGPQPTLFPDLCILFIGNEPRIKALDFISGAYATSQRTAGYSVYVHTLAVLSRDPSSVLSSQRRLSGVLSRWASGLQDHVPMGSFFAAKWISLSKVNLCRIRISAGVVKQRLRESLGAEAHGQERSFHTPNICHS